MVKTAAEQLRALAEMLEESGAGVERCAAAGNERIIVISLYVSEGGNDMILAFNQPHTRKKLRKSSDDKTVELKL